MKNIESKRNESTTVQEVNIVIPPDGGYAWIVLIAAFLSNFCVDGIAFSYGVAIQNDLSERLKLPISKVAVISSIQLGVYYTFGPLACAFVNHYGFRIVGIWGCVIAFTGIYASSHTESYVAIILLYGVVGGIGFGMIYTAGIISVGYYFEKYRAVATGLSVCGSSIGGLCLSPLLAHITASKGWDYSMRIESMLLFVCLLSSFTYRPLKPTTTVPLTQDLFNEMDNLKTPSRVEFVELYKTNSMVSIDLDDHSEESRHFPQISIISSRFLPITEMRKKKRKLCSCTWLRELCSVQHTHDTAKPNVISTGPMDRKDIFYSASVVHLPEYKMSKTEDGSLRRKNVLSYHVSMVLDPQIIHSSIESAAVASKFSIQQKSRTCFNISHLMHKALSNLFDFTLLRSMVFCLLAMACLCYSLAWMTPYLYISQRGIDNNIPKKYTDWFISCISIGNAVGRASAGIIATVCCHINSCYLAGVATVFAGVVTIIATYIQASNVDFQICYCIVFGFCIAFLTALRPVIFVQLLGLPKLTNAFGLSALMIGIGLFSGTPIASLMIETSESYLSAFVLTGILFIIGGVLIILAFYVYLWQERKIKK